MDLSTFKSLSTQDAMAAAATIAGVDASVIDGIWRAESGRGQHMKSKAGAEGHFQLMPQTRATVEKRIGATIDPYDLKESMFAAAHLLGENLRRFGSVPDALRAYNGGWDPRKWGNKETSEYVGRVLGRDSPAPVDLAPPAGASFESLWGDRTAPVVEVPDVPKPEKAHAPKLTEEEQVAVQDAYNAGGMGAADAAKANPQRAVELTRDLHEAPVTEVDGPSLVDGAVKETEAATAAQTKVDNTTFLETVRAGIPHNGMTSAIIRKFSRPDFEPVPGYTVKQEDIDGYDGDTQYELRQSESPEELAQLRREADIRLQDEQLIATQGTGTQIAASLVGGLTDVTSLVAGAGIGKALQLAKVGSLAFAQAGRVGAAVTSAVAENVGGNVALLAAEEAMTQRKSPADYIMAGLFGLIPAAVHGTVAGTTAARAHALANEIADVEAGKVTKAAEELGEAATPETVARRVQEADDADIRKTVGTAVTEADDGRKFFPDTLNEVADDGPAAAAAVDVHPGHDVEAMRWADPDFAARVHEGGLRGASDDRLTAAGFGTHGDMSLRPAGVHAIGDVPAAHLDFVAANMNLLPTGSRVAVRMVDTGEMDGFFKKASTADAGVLTLGDTHYIAVRRGSTPGQTVHEFGHAVAQAWLHRMPKEIVDGLRSGWNDALREAGTPEFTAARWSLANMGEANVAGKVADTSNKYTASMNEWLAEQFVKSAQADKVAVPAETRKALDRAIAKVKAMLQALGDLFQRAKDAGHIDPHENYLKFLKKVTENRDVHQVQASKSAEDIAPSAHEAVDSMADATPYQRAKKAAMQRLWANANAAPLPDQERLKTIMDSPMVRGNLMSSGLTLMKSKNAILRKVATDLLESTTGAGGRNDTAALAKFIHERAIMGNAINDYEEAFSKYRNARGVNRVQSFFDASHYNNFNKQVAEEIEARRLNSPAYPNSPDVHVRTAADILESGFDRARQLQVDSKVAGWAALGDTSVGYLPRKMSPAKVKNLTDAQRTVIKDALHTQLFTGGMDFDMATRVSGAYLDRMIHRALGGYDVEANVAHPSAGDILAEVLTQQGMSRQDALDRIGLVRKAAAQNTKHRLNLNLLEQHDDGNGGTFRLLDLFEDDGLRLLRHQASSASGHVALMKFGIAGQDGLSMLKEAVLRSPDNQLPTPDEMKAFDRISSEFLGQPAPGEVNSAAAQGLMQFTSLVRLGGLVAAQAGETINIGVHLGVTAALKHVSGLARLRSEILSMAKGQASTNPLLSSIEIVGGAEFGTDSYKMVLPFENTIAETPVYNHESPNMVQRLLRAGVHGQAIASGWRVMEATQRRAVAEQIVHKVVKFASGRAVGGITEANLKDMGFDSAMAAKLRQAMPQAAQFDAAGNLVGFDVRALPADVQMPFIQAVHRGAAQIIQGTFIGETGAWAHNDWLKLMAQFRTFGVIAMEKQWARSRSNHGVAKTVALLLASMSVAIPIHAARTVVNSIGKDDQEKYLEDNMGVAQMARASANYVALAGLAPDLLDLLSATTGVGDVVGLRSGGNKDFVGQAFGPAAGVLNDTYQGIGQLLKDGNPEKLGRTLPFNRLPYLVPAFNVVLEH